MKNCGNCTPTRKASLPDGATPRAMVDKPVELLIQFTISSNRGHREGVCAPRLGRNSCFLPSLRWSAATCLPACATIGYTSGPNPSSLLLRWAAASPVRSCPGRPACQPGRRQTTCPHAAMQSGLVSSSRKLCTVFRAVDAGFSFAALRPVKQGLPFLFAPICVRLFARPVACLLACLLACLPAHALLFSCFTHLPG